MVPSNVVEMTAPFDPVKTVLEDTKPLPCEGYLSRARLSDGASSFSAESAISSQR